MHRDYYSQNGEDRILWALFEDKKTPGIFLDVGALDGKVFSNTYSFELAGWSGICIEAHPTYIAYLKKNRPNSIIVHAAVSDRNKNKVTFYANARGALSTLVGELREHFATKYARHKPKWDEIKVPMRTLSNILEVNNINNIDFVSIDIEGGELAALRGFDFSTIRPRVFVIEAINAARAKATTKFMSSVGYAFARSVSNNFFYCRDIEDVSIIKNANKNGKLIITKHPCDIKK